MFRVALDEQITSHAAFSTLVWNIALFEVCLEDAEQLVMRQALRTELFHGARRGVRGHYEDLIAFLHPVTRDVDEHHPRRLANLPEKIFELTFHGRLVRDIVHFFSPRF